MMYRGIILSIFTVVLFALPGVSYSKTWDKILPQATSLKIFTSPDDCVVAGTVFDIEWPAAVDSVDGQWLKIHDAGGYSSKPLKGWVRKGDVAQLDESQSQFTDKIRASQP